MNGTVLRLLGRITILSWPLLLGVVSYAILDPFKDVHHRDNFYDGSPVVLNRDFVSTQYFLDTYEKARYDAFIFGSSRSQAFHCQDWLAYLADDVRPFHFDAWSESLFGIWSKVRFLDEREVPIREALIVLDRETLGLTGNVRSHLFVKHPATSRESPWVFQALFLGTFFSRGFFIKYVDWRLFGTIRPYMLDIFEEGSLRQVRETNDVIFQSAEEELRVGGEDAYYAKRARVFSLRQPGESPPGIGPVQVAMLSDIALRLKNQRTRLRVVLSPLYDEMRLASADREVLERTFGPANVCDFSGVNEWTSSYRNYYEKSHYRPHVARALLRIAYGPNAGRCNPSPQSHFVRAPEAGADGADRE